MLDILKQARAAFTVLNPEEARKRAARPVHIGLVAGSPDDYAELERFLLPGGAGPGDAAAAPRLLHRADDAEVPGSVDLVVYSHRLPHSDGAYRFDPDDPGALVSAILHDNEDLDLALARQFPPFRRVVVDRLVHAISLENALFAFATALPDVVPSLIELPWALGEFASDIAFLTANQVRMAFMVAAACGKPVSFGKQKAEILGIAGSAFGWRALARELAGKIPFGGGLIPKAAIAYAGTYAVGKALAYYEEGKGHYSRAQRKSIYAEALQRGKSIARSFGSRR